MIELIWDGHHNGTIVTPSGVTLDCNPESAFSPLDLLAAAAAIARVPHPGQTAGV